MKITQVTSKFWDSDVKVGSAKYIHGTVGPKNAEM
jgi:hypothetical protein